MSLKEKIIENEKYLLEELNGEYKLAIQFFIKKIESLDRDGDIIKFIGNPNFETPKKEQYDYIHNKGLKTAVDIMHEYIEDYFSCSTVKNIAVGSAVSCMTISSIANNFNTQVGMYYNEYDDILLLKMQIKNGPYNDGWIEKNKQIRFFLQDEKNKKSYINLDFRKKPNRICGDILSGKNKHTKVYLFYRYEKGDNYIFDGRYIPIKYDCNNEAIILNKFDNKKCLKLEVLKEDLLIQNVDVIVNAANVQLQRGGGICGAIFRKCGHPYELQEECGKLAPIKPGDAVITNAYDLKSKYIIHAVGPIYGINKPEDKILAEAYINSLKLADEKGLRTIAFPSISTGIFGFPIDEAAKIACDVINNYVPKSLEKCYMCCLDNKTYDAFVKFNF